MTQSLPISKGDTRSVRVAMVGEVPPGRSVLRKIDGLEILLCRVGQNIFAIENRCSHLGRPLGEGRLNGCLITCPVHAAQFDVRDGGPKGFPATRPIATYAVTVSAGEIWVCVPG